MKLIVGLGNPGDEYLGTRHNLGFSFLEELRKHLKIENDWQMNSKFNSEIIKSEGLILARPQTYMNLSGDAIAKIANFYKIKPDNIVVVHDELDLLLGHLKIRKGGAAAGHHGVESVINSLGTPDFIRVRLGIGTTQGFLGEHKRTSFSAEKFVMELFLPNETSSVKSMFKQALKGIDTLLKDGLEKAQNQYN